MIVKRSPAKQAKSKGQHIYDLYHYIHASFDRKSDQKVIQSGVLNMSSTDSAAIITEMETLACKAIRTRMPIEHWILSLPADEHFDPRTTKDIVGMFIDGLGYNGCQTIYTVHGNTDHEHLHVVLNHIDPKTLQCRKSDWQVLKAHKAIARICDTFGFSKTDHQTYTKDDNGEYVRAVHTASDREQVRLSNNAVESEVRSGQKSLLRIAIVEALPILRSANTWEELHSRLAEIGFEYHPKGGCAVLVGHVEGGEEYPMKASSVHRSCSLKNLQKRLGQYTPSAATIVPRRSEPIDGITRNELEQYQQYRHDVYNNNADLVPKQDDILDKLTNELNELKLEYNRLRSENPTNITDRALIKAHSEYIKEQQISSISNKINVLKSANTPVATQPLPFNEWSANYKHQDHFVNVTAEITTETQSQIQVFNQIHQAIGARYYRVHAEKDGKVTKIYFNSNRSRNYTANDIITQVLPRSRVIVYFTPWEFDERTIYIKPRTQEEWDYIMWLREQRNIRPALVLHNNNNFDVYYKVSPPTYQNEEMIFQEISKTLKIKIELKAKIPSPTARNTVDVVENSGNTCPVLSDLVRKLDGLFTNKRKNINNDDDELYTVHYNDILKHINKKYSDEELYEMIGVRLRATGHNRIDILRILKRHTDNANAIVNNVFGSTADKQLTRFRRFFKNWKILEESLDQNWHERVDTIPTITQEQQKLYTANYNDITKHLKKQIEDRERIDRMIAVRLRATGHKENEIAKIISACSKKDKRYGIKVAKEACGEYGDKQLNRYWKYLSDWRMLEQPKLNNYNNDNIKLYNAHYNDIIRLTRKPNTEPKKIDGMIAIRLRATGHNRLEIADTIASGRHQDNEYANNIAKIAFSNEGNKQINRYSKYIKEWKLIDESLDLKWYMERGRKFEEAKEKERKEERGCEVERIEEEEDSDQQLRM